MFCSDIWRRQRVSLIFFTEWGNTVPARIVHNRTVSTCAVPRDSLHDLHPPPPPRRGGRPPRIVCVVPGDDGWGFSLRINEGFDQLNVPLLPDWSLRERNSIGSFNFHHECISFITRKTLAAKVRALRTLTESFCFNVRIGGFYWVFILSNTVFCFLCFLPRKSKLLYQTWSNFANNKKNR